MMVSVNLVVAHRQRRMDAAAIELDARPGWFGPPPRIMIFLSVGLALHLPLGRIIYAVSVVNSGAAGIDAPVYRRMPNMAALAHRRLAVRVRCARRRNRQTCASGKRNFPRTTREIALSICSSRSTSSLICWETTDRSEPGEDLPSTCRRRTHRRRTHKRSGVGLASWFVDGSGDLTVGDDPLKPVDARLPARAAPSAATPGKSGPMAITSPTDFICVVSAVGRPAGTSRSAKRGHLGDDVVDRSAIRTTPGPRLPVMPLATSCRACSRPGAEFGGRPWRSGNAGGLAFASASIEIERDTRGSHPR